MEPEFIPLERREGFKRNYSTKCRSLDRLRGIAFDAWYLSLTRVQKRRLVNKLYKERQIDKVFMETDCLKVYFEKTKWPIFLEKLKKLKNKYNN